MYYNNLKRLRNEKELTQDDIAKILNRSRSTYNNWERGIVMIPLDVIDQLSVYYKVSLSCVLGIDKKIEYKSKIKKMNYDVLLNNLRELRKKNKHTYNEVAVYLKCTEATCQRYFTGVIKIPMDRLVLLSELYNIDLDNLCDKE